MAIGFSQHGFVARRRDWWMSLGVILALVFIAYIPSLSNGFTNWDDRSYVADNPLLASPGFKAVLLTPVCGNYSPLTVWSLALNFAISRYDAASYHWLNLVLHLLNTALVFAFVRRLSAGRFWTTTVTALLFGIHPMHVESVAWIAARKDVLYALFYLTGLLLYLRYLDTLRPMWLLGVFGAFVLAVASKPAAVIFPLTLVAIDYLRRRPMHRAVLLEKVPFLVVSVLGALLAFKGQAELGALDRNLHDGLFARVMFAPYGLMTYLAKAIAPMRLSALYPIPKTESGALGWELYFSLVAMAVLVPLLVIRFRRHRAVLFGLAFFLINLVLVLQVVAVGAAIVADRFTYLPYIGLFLAASWWLDEPESRPVLKRRARLLLAGAMVLLCSSCLALTWRRCAVWQTGETLWNDVIEKYPRTMAFAYNNRADAYRADGRLDQALADYDMALELSSSHAVVWIGRGDVLCALHRPAAAIASYDSALALATRDDSLKSPRNMAYPLDKRGSARLQSGDYTGAVADFSRSLDLCPDDPSAYRCRGLAYDGLSERERAIADWREAIALAPDDPSAPFYLNAIGLALQKLGRHREAIEAFDRAITLGSSDPGLVTSCHRSRAVSWRDLGQVSRAQYR